MNYDKNPMLLGAPHGATDGACLDLTVYVIL